MRTRSSSNLPVVSSNPSTSNPKRRNHRRSKQPFILEESLVDTMADQCTMAELLHAPTEGYAEAIVVPPILAEQFELKHSLINMITSDQFFGLKKDNPHDHIRWFNKITSTIKYKDVPNSAIKLMIFRSLSQGQPAGGLKKNPRSTNSLNAAAGGNLLERRTQDVLTIIENKSKVRNSRNKSVVSQVKSCDANSNSSSEIAKLTHAVNQQTSAVTTVMKAILKQFQATPPPASLKAVSAAVVNYNQGNFVYRPPEQSYQAPTQQNQIVPLNELEKLKRMNEANMKAMQTQINIMKNELRNEMKNSIQASLSNQTIEIKNMMASLFQMNTASTSGLGSLLSNTVSNPKGELKAITTQSGIVLDGPTVPTPPSFINLEEDERVKETLTDPDLSEYTIKVPPPPVQKYKPPSQRDYVVHQRDPIHPNIPYPSRMLKQKQQKKDKKLGLPELISTRMTLELANRAIYTPTGIERDVFVPVGKFTFPADFVIVDYESDPRVPLILGRPFLRTARALINVHSEEMILCDGDERLTLNMRHDTSSYSNQSQKESDNLINVFNNSSEDFLEDLFLTNQPSGNLTFSSHHELISLEVQNDIFDPDGGNVLPEKLLDLDSTKDFHPPLHVNPLSGNATYSSSSLLEELADELALITFSLKYDDDLQFDVDNLDNPADNFVDSMPEMFTDEHALNYSSPLIFDEYDDEFLEVESDTENVYDVPFDSNGEKIKESKLLIDELDLPCDFLPPSDIPGNLKTHAEGFCPLVFISSASLGNHPGHLAARLGCAEMKFAT
nr:reverse transcriptase domain-containing protein [Tanacetum cinerariifolium]